MIFYDSSSAKEAVTPIGMSSLALNDNVQIPFASITTTESQLPSMLSVDSLQMQNEPSQPNILIEESRPQFKYEAKGRKLSPKSSLSMVAPYGIPLAKQAPSRNVPVYEMVVVKEPPLNLVVK